MLSLSGPTEIYLILQPIASSIYFTYFFAFGGNSDQVLIDEISLFHPLKYLIIGFALFSSTGNGKVLISFPFTTLFYFKRNN